MFYIFQKRAAAIIGALVLLGAGCAGATRPGVTTGGGQTVDVTASAPKYAFYQDLRYEFLNFSYPAVYAVDPDCKPQAGGDPYTVRVGNTIAISAAVAPKMNLGNYVIKEFGELGLAIETNEDFAVGGLPGRRVTYRAGGANRYGEAALVIKDSILFTINFTAGAFTCEVRHPETREPAVYQDIVNTFGDGGITNEQSYE